MPPSSATFSDFVALSRDPRLRLAVLISLTLGTLATVIMGAFWLRGRGAGPTAWPAPSMASRVFGSSHRSADPKANAIEQLSAAGANLTARHVDGASTAMMFIRPGTRFDLPQGEETLAQYAKMDLFSALVQAPIGRPFTDAEVEQLLALPTIEEVTLVNTNVSDAGLARLAELPNLKRLTIWQSDCTEQGLLQFQQAHGRRIHFDHDNGLKAKRRGR